MEYNIVIKDDRPKVTVVDDRPRLIVADKGIQGPVGPIGPVGPQGIQGIQGVQGIQGPQGPAVQDTGWRNVTASAPTALSPSNVGSLFMRRIGNTVYLAASDLLLLQGTGLLTVYAVPLGFRPSMKSGGFADFAYWRKNSLAAKQNMVLNSTALYWMSETQTTSALITQARPPVSIQGQGNYLTDDTWPATLPGTAA